MQVLISRSTLVWVLLFGLLALFPWLATMAGQDFYIGVVIRIMIFAIAASSLNLILGYGGMVSFGHAAFFGLGAYAASIAVVHGADNVWLVWALAALVGGLSAFAVGYVATRTRGAYFIMITLAMGQLFYFLFVGLRQYGGDDGLRMPTRPALGLGLDISSEMVFYAVVLLWTLLMHLMLARLVRSRFGLALEAVRENEQRMGAIGYSTRQYRIIAFVVAGVMAGVAGALLAMHNQFVSPKLLHWSQSGTLMIMVALGGMGRLHGGFLGAAALLLLEEVLSSYFSYWHIYVGAVLLLVVMVSPDGLAGLGRLFRRAPAATTGGGRNQ